MGLSKLHIRTFGCQMNEYDSNKMSDVLKHSHGLELTDDIDQADVLLVNTCSIREKAEEKLFHQLGRWKKLKTTKPNLVIGVGGCVASQEGDLILKRAPYVDLIFGPQTLHRLPNMLNDVLDKSQVSIDISFPEIEKFDHLPEPHSDTASAFVSVMEGCSKYCTFCVVPYTRGEEISRPFNDVIREVEVLAEQGVKEINLLGQNVNAYRGLMDDGEIADLALLIAIVAQVSGIERIRYTTSHPVEFSDRLIKTYAEVPELVSHVHLPVQSGSDKILGSMKRGHTVIEYKSKIRKLREIRSDISLSSDFIIGFPGETEEDFNSTMKLIDKVKFKKLLSNLTIEETIAGGSVANSIVGLSQLGNAVSFIGKVNDDELGNKYEKSLTNKKVKYCYQKKKESIPTGTCLILITPDAERTMCTFFGIAGKIRDKDIDENAVKNSK